MKVIDWPVTEGFADEATVVVVSALFTLCASVDEVDALKFASLEETAVIAWLLPPAALKLVLQVAWAAAVQRLGRAARDRRAVGLELTVPVGVPAPGEFTVTVAVNVTD